MDFADRFPARPILTWAAAQGIDAGESLFLGGPAIEYVSHAALHRLYVVLVEHGFDETCGLEIGGLCGLDNLGLVGQIGQHSSTFFEAADLYMQYRDMLTTPQTFVDMDPSLDHFTIFIFAPTDPQWLQSLNFRLAFAYAHTVNIVREMFDDATLQCLAVGFPSSDDTYAETYRGYFNAEVSFGTDQSYIRFPSALLHRSIPRAVSSTRPFLEEMARMQMQQKQELGLLSPTDFLVMLRKELREAILTGETNNDADAIAQRLNISTRTLQRRLKDHHLSFREISEQVQRDLAYKLLTNPSLSIQEVAYKLGYTQASSFSRAFKRWTGLSPREVREG